MSVHEHHSTFGPIISTAIKDIEATPGRLIRDVGSVADQITSEITIRHDHADSDVPHHHLAVDGTSAPVPVPVMPAPAPVAPAPVAPAPIATYADLYGRPVPASAPAAPAPVAPAPKPEKTAGLWDF